MAYQRKKPGSGSSGWGKGSSASGPDLRPGCPVVSFYLTGKEIMNVLEVSALLTEYMERTTVDYFFQVSGLRYKYDPNRAILFHAPIVDMPVPSFRAVTKAELYTGEGIQTDDDNDYRRLRRNDNQLYRVVTDSNVMIHVPEVGNMLPPMAIVPKDSEGNPLEYITEHGDVLESINVYDNEGNEVKMWQVLVHYAAMQQPGPDGIPVIPAYYEDTTGRIVGVWTIPLLIWPILVLFALVVLIVLLKRRKRLQKAGSGSS